MAVPPVSMDLFALATLPAAADEAGGPPSIKFYELRDNLERVQRRCSGHKVSEDAQRVLQLLPGDHQDG
jgi:hypothetical protein